MVLCPTVQCCEEISRLRLSFRLQIGNAIDYMSKIEMHSGGCGYFTVLNPTFRFIGIFQSLCLQEQLGKCNLGLLFEKCVQAYEIKLKAITNKVIQLENDYEGQQEYADTIQSSRINFGAKMYYLLGFQQVNRFNFEGLSLPLLNVDRTGEQRLCIIL